MISFAVGEKGTSTKKFLQDLQDLLSRRRKGVKEALCQLKKKSYICSLAFGLRQREKPFADNDIHE